MIPHLFAPASSSRRRQWVDWQDTFREDEIPRLVEYLDALPQSRGQIGREGKTDPQRRDNQVALVELDVESIWIFERLASAGTAINDRWFNFDLTGFCEPLQYVVYEAPGGHYEWHVDNGGTAAPRKLSLSLQLSRPEEYEGGELELFFGGQAVCAPAGLGRLVAFPSYAVHRVRPVRSGIRRALVAWVNGPEFR